MGGSPITNQAGRWRSYGLAVTASPRADRWISPTAHDHILDVVRLGNAVEERQHGGGEGVVVVACDHMASPADVDVLGGGRRGAQLCDRVVADEVGQQTANK